MVKLIIINGTMGVGKSSVCRELYHRLENSVWLDGDWCWMMNPFIVNDENKQMAINNITYLLRSFLTNSSIKFVLFTWVIHREEIFNLILDRLQDLSFDIIKITLLCNPEALTSRIAKDIRNHLRDDQCLIRSLQRLPLYQDMDTIKIDTSNISIEETMMQIKKIIVQNN